MKAEQKTLNALLMDTMFGEDHAASLLSGHLLCGVIRRYNELGTPQEHRIAVQNARTIHTREQLEEESKKGYDVLVLGENLGSRMTGGLEIYHAVKALRKQPTHPLTLLLMRATRDIFRPPKAELIGPFDYLIGTAGCDKPWELAGNMIGEHYANKTMQQEDA